MRQVGPDSHQVLEVIGTPAFENFVRELEGEGVHIPTGAEASEAANHGRADPGAGEFDIEILADGTVARTLLQASRRLRSVLR